MKIKLILLITFVNTLFSYSQQIGNGYASYLTDLTQPLMTGVYNGVNPLGMTPDNSHDWQHLFVIRHQNPDNNHQLQIASSFNTNDRLFFRKIAAALTTSNPDWIEIATRGTNNFIGNQNIAGKLETLNTSQGITSFKTIGVNGYMLIDNVGSGENYYSANNFHEFQIGGISKMRINSNGNVGIGTTSPYSYQHGGNNKVIEINNINTSINSQSHLILSTGSTLPNSSLGTLTWAMPNSTSPYKGLAYIAAVSGANSTLGNPSSSIVFATRNDSQDNWKNNMILSDSGNLGVGTMNPDSKLAVNGTIHSKEVKVDMNGWSDFVFKKEYNLPTLEQVEKQIIEKGHLENIPSEEEVLKNGINLGEMNAKLLQKIEELTLYMIEMKKENIEMKKRIEQVEKK